MSVKVKAIKATTIAQWDFILIQILVPVMCGIFSIELGQDINWDFQNYHLYSPYAFLHGRINFDMAPAGEQSYFNPCMDLVYFLGIRHVVPWLAGFILGFIQGLNFIVSLHICRYCLKAINIKEARWAMALAFLGLFL